MTVINVITFFNRLTALIYIYIYIYCIYIYILVSHKSEYTPHISATILVYILKGQYYRNETWIYFRVVKVQLV